MNETDLIRQRVRDSIAVKESFLDDEELITEVGILSDKITDSLTTGGKLIICGNGGSASDALHFAGEIVGRFQKERNPWPAVVLNSDVATITAIANDYGYDHVFERQAKAFSHSGDVFVGISTSGNSENVYLGVKAARESGAYTSALLGHDGGKILDEVDCPLIVRSSVTARIQECHIMIIHILCELIEGKV